jgi:hypothetical protein
MEDLLQKLEPKAIAILNKITSSNEKLKTLLAKQPQRFLVNLGFLDENLRPIEVEEYFQYEEDSRYEGGFYGYFCFKYEIMDELLVLNCDNVVYYKVEDCSTETFSIEDAEKYFNLNEEN